MKKGGKVTLLWGNLTTVPQPGDQGQRQVIYLVDSMYPGYDVMILALYPCGLPGKNP